MLLIVFTALVFYGLFPLWGAWRLRRTWYFFRDDCLKALRSPEVSFSHLRPDHPPPDDLTLIGRLEAIEGQDRFWIGNDQVSVAVSLRGVSVYFVEDLDPFAVGVEPPRRADAATLGALAEGTQFLVWGTLVHDERGQIQFASTGRRRLLVLAFEGDPSNVLLRAVYAGRPVIEHWNSWTPVSAGLGFLILLVAAYAELRPMGDRQAGMIGLALALLPSTFFLPPGILFFYGFARLWAWARDRRAQADRDRMEGLATDRAQARREARRREYAALVCLVLAMVSNAALLSFLIRLWLP